jgi:crotonobetainyl-CoA:carnitine CoA-transferase CaiB-like acyl-CoA transferase
LDDIRILSVEQYAAGPFATAQLVDLGADVIKIEDPAAGGDVGRHVPPHQRLDSSLFFETFNRGKRSVTLKLEIPSGRRVFEDLVRRADVVFANVRGDVPEKLGLRYEDLKHVNPAIVCCFLTAYGMTGSEQSVGGYDYIMQARAGWMSLTGEPGSVPEKSGLSLVDYSAGLAAAVAMVSAVHRARRTGEGDNCDISLFDTAIGLLTYLATWYLSAGVLPSRTHHSAHPSLVPFQNFQTSDGWVVVACAKEKFWERLTEAIGRPELADDPRYATFALRREHADRLLPELELTFKSRTTEDWLRLLGDVGIPCGKVNDVEEALLDPLVTERRLIVETDHPGLGRVRQVAGPVRVGSFAPVDRRGPLLGEHNVEVLEDVLSFGGDQISEVLERGAFGLVSRDAAGEEARA